jgi:hypothetical protein
VQAVSLHVVAKPFEGKNASSQLCVTKMKRCPQCNRVETDDALVFCRADGSALANDSSSLNTEAGTAKLTSVTTESETSILPH